MQEPNDSAGGEVSFFVEKTRVVELIALVCCGSNGDFLASFDSLSEIMVKYLEQPHLLFPHLPEMTAPINSSTDDILARILNRDEDQCASKQDLVR